MRRNGLQSQRVPQQQRIWIAFEVVCARRFVVILTQKVAKQFRIGGERLPQLVFADCAAGGALPRFADRLADALPKFRVMRDDAINVVP